MLLLLTTSACPCLQHSHNLGSFGRALKNLKISSRYRMTEAERRIDGGIDRAPRFDLDPLPSQWTRSSSSSMMGEGEEAEYWKSLSRSQEARQQRRPRPSSSFTQPNRNGWRASGGEAESGGFKLRPPRPPPPLDPNLAPAANYLKSRFGSNPFPYPDRGGASIYFPASSGKLVSRRAVNARHFNEMPWFAWHEVI